jgi:hypothetical protein
MQDRYQIDNKKILDWAKSEENKTFLLENFTRLNPNLR